MKNRFASSPLVRRRRRHLGQDLGPLLVSVIIHGGVWGRGEVGYLGRGYWFEDSGSVVTIRFHWWDAVIFSPGQHEHIFRSTCHSWYMPCCLQRVCLSTHKVSLAMMFLWIGSSTFFQRTSRRRGVWRQPLVSASAEKSRVGSVFFLSFIVLSVKCSAFFPRTS
jgi:hypothetical protein